MRKATEALLPLPDPRKFILDANVWSHLADVDAGLDLHRQARRVNVAIYAAPSVLYELLRIGNPAARRRAVRLITERHWTRLMPEAYLESQQIIDAVRRSRPEWVIETPERFEHDRTARDWSRTNTPALRRLRSPNKAGVWERARNAPEIFAQQLGDVDGYVLERARADATAARLEMRASGMPGPGPLNSAMAVFRGPVAGWDGEPVECWRIETLAALDFALVQGATQAYLDWVAPFVNLPMIRCDRAAWVRLWLYDVEEAEVSRQWIRWAFHYMQRFRKVSSGTPCDVQLSAYLPDGDAMVSADKQFVELVGQCANYAPCRIAVSKLVPGGAAAVDGLFDLLERSTAG